MADARGHDSVPLVDVRQEKDGGSGGCSAKGRLHRLSERLLQKGRIKNVEWLFDETA